MNYGYKKKNIKDSKPELICWTGEIRTQNSFILVLSKEENTTKLRGLKMKQGSGKLVMRI